MIDSLIKHENINNNKDNIKNLITDVFLLPKWEKIKTFSITDKNFLFKNNVLNLNLYRKFSSKNKLEKYSLKTDDEKILSNMDLKIYKDSVYIINLEINSQMHFEKILEKMLQVAIEKSLYNTTEKEVVINLTNDIITNHRLKKYLINNGFKTEENQSKYEKELFGETYSYKIDDSSCWNKRIKQFPFLINK